MHWIYLAGAILAEVVATSVMKATDGFSRPWPSFATIACYAVAFYLLSLTLDIIPLGIAYAIWSGAGIILVSAAAWVFYRQTLDVAAITGIGLIVTGVVVLNFFSKSAPH